MNTATIAVGDAPRVKTGRDAAAYLQDWLTVIVPDAAERAECLRRFADAIWTNTAQVVERLEEYAAEIDPCAHEPEPVEYSLGDVDMVERTVANAGDDVSHPDAFDAWLQEECIRG